MGLPYAFFFSLLCDSSMLLTAFSLLFSNVLVLYRIIYPVNCWRHLSWLLFGDLIGNGAKPLCLYLGVCVYILRSVFQEQDSGLVDRMHSINLAIYG